MENINEKPLVSVLIPTHERAKLFSLALASVVMQTYSNIEIIVSDNSMDDETEVIVKEFQAKYDNIRYFHTPGLDMHGNWQKCWDNMSDSAQYVNFLMDDDIFATNKIERMMDFFIENPKLSLVTSYRKLIDINGNLLPDLGCNSKVVDTDSIIEGEEAGYHLLVNGVNWIGEPTTVLFNRKYTNGFFRGWTGKEKYLILDYPLWLRLLEQGPMAYIVEPLSFFRQHEKNDSKNFNTIVEGQLSMAYTISTAWEKKRYLKETSSIRKALFLWCGDTLRIMQACYECGYKREAFDELRDVYRKMTDAYSHDKPIDVILVSGE